MVQTECISDQKHDLTQLSHAVQDGQVVTRRRKGTKMRRKGASKSPTVSPTDRHHQILLYVDSRGIIRADGSSTITLDEQGKILQAAVPKYREALQRIKSALIQQSFAAKPNAEGGASHVGEQCQPKCTSPAPHIDHTASKTPTLKPPRKRARASSEDRSSWLQDDNKSHATERSDSVETVENQTQLIGIEVRDSEKLKEHLFEAFTAFQQINCRTLCKSWIRTIEPKKQVNHPYNGNLKVKGAQKFPSNDLSTQKDSDPEETKPKWWPSKEECPHKEPDHIKKEQRLALLCHILMNTHRLHDCSTEDLRAALESDKAKMKPAGKEVILEDVWKIGRALENFRSGGQDGTAMIYVNAHRDDAQTTRGGGRLKKSLDAKDESEIEESSPDPEIVPEEAKTLTPITSSALISSVPYLHANQASIVPQAHLDECRYVENRSIHHFRPPESKDSYQDHQAGYSMPAQVTSSLGDMSQHGPPGHGFDGSPFVDSSYGNMQDIRSHSDIFSPDEQQTMGQWSLVATPDLYPMHYTGEPSQPPSINPADRNHLFDNYPYPGPHKQPYRSNINGYFVDIHAPFSAGYEDDLARFQRTHTCSLPSQPTPRFQPASMMNQHSYDLPSHVRA